MTCRNSIICSKGFYRKISTGFECSIFIQLWHAKANRIGVTRNLRGSSMCILNSRNHPQREQGALRMNGEGCSDLLSEFGVRGVMRE